MPLSQEICAELVRLSGDPRTSVQIDDNGITVNGELIPSPGVPALRSLIDGFSVADSQNGWARFENSTKTVIIQKVTFRQSSGAGLIEVEPGQSWLFLGNLGSNSEAVDLSACPELLLALAALSPDRTDVAVRDWTSIIESLGPLVVSLGRTPEAALAEVGCFCIRSAVSVIPYDAPTQMRGFTARPGISDESIAAYVLALEAQDGPDVTVHRLYRVFELEFAKSVQDDIARTTPGQLWNKLKNLKLTELKGLEATVAKTGASFAHFTRADFDNLFGTTHQPSDQYGALKAWLRDRTNPSPSGDCRAHIIYYVRNALVHSKASDGDPSLFGPYEGPRATALVHLAQDIHSIVREIIAV